MTDSADEDAYTQLILQQLDKYNATLLDEEDFKERKRKAKEKKLKRNALLKKSSQDGETEESSQQSNSRTLHSKKKKKHKKDMQMSESKNNLTKDSTQKSKVVAAKKLQGKQRHLDQMKSELGLLDMNESNSNPCSNPCQPTIHPISQPNQKKKRPPPEVICFEQPRKKTKKVVAEGNVAEEVPRDGVEYFDMKRAKFEVQKLGITGLDAKEKQDANIALALQLGAHRPKKEYTNYKLYQEQRKQSIVDARAKHETDRQLGLRVSSSNRRKGSKPQGREDRIKGFLDGQVGQYKNGVQVIRQLDIVKTKNKTGKKSGRK